MKILYIKETPVLIDDEDFPKISQDKWHINHGYVVRNPKVKDNKKFGKIWMHHVILPPSENMCVDHINGNPLDNRKENLRICTLEQNQWNRKTPRDNTTGYKNISWNKKRKVFGVAYRLKGKVIWVGKYKTIEEALVARNKIIQIREEYGTAR